LDKAWYLSHPEIMEMKKSEELSFMMESGALVIQAHPFREASYIDHLRLFPRNVYGVEIVNAARTDAENEMARIYAEYYGLLPFAGTDNHRAGRQTALAGIATADPVADEKDFVQKFLHRQADIFVLENQKI
ncbi:MAG: PHP domain-containing protein, partial [Clostridia bacterium]|nr:PHP domain-containing protein [Clostridia bacterium]